MLCRQKLTSGVIQHLEVRVIYLRYTRLPNKQFIYLIPTGGIKISDYIAKFGGRRFSSFYIFPPPSIYF